MLETMDESVSLVSPFLRSSPTHFNLFGVTLEPLAIE